MNPNITTMPSSPGLMQDIAPRPAPAPMQPMNSVEVRPAPFVMSPVAERTNFVTAPAPVASPVTTAPTPTPSNALQPAPAAPKSTAQYPFTAIIVAVLVTAALVFAAIMAYRQNTNL